MANDWTEKKSSEKDAILNTQTQTHLCVGAVLSVTVVADEHVSLGSAHLGQLVFSDGLFGQSLSDLLQLCARHLLRTHARICTHTHAHTRRLY